MADEIDIRFDFSGFSHGLEEHLMRVSVATEEALPLAVDVIREKVHPKNEKSGKLRESIQSERVERKGAGEWAVVAGPTAPYARIVELGHKKGAKRGKHRTRPGHRAPHPWFLPGVERESMSIREVFAMAWERAQGRI